MASFLTGGGGGPGPTLSRAEVVAEIEALGDGEKTALAKIARLYANKTPYDHADLLQEALCRVLSGERKWPKGVSPLLFLGGVIRSVAWQWRRREQWSGAANDTAVGPPQEWTLFLDEVIAFFDDDATAKAVLLAMMAGNKGEELLAVIEPMLAADRESSSGDLVARADVERELERILKKIRRRVERHRREAGPL